MDGVPTLNIGNCVVLHLWPFMRDVSVKEEPNVGGEVPL